MGSDGGTAPGVSGKCSGKVDVGGYPAEGRGAAGRFRRLREHAVVAAGPVVRHRHVDVGVGLNAARQHDHAGGVDGLAGADIVEDTRGGHRRDLLALDADIPQANAVRCDHGPALDDQVQHDFPPERTCCEQRPRRTLRKPPRVAAIITRLSKAQVTPAVVIRAPASARRLRLDWLQPGPTRPSTARHRRDVQGSPAFPARVRCPLPTGRDGSSPAPLPAADPGAWG